jgi:uncharacterized iron-regulated protein
MLYRIPIFAALAGSLACMGACGGHYHAAGPPTTSPDGAPRGVEAAGLPYKILDGRTGHELATAEFWTALGGARAVCVGEEHPNPHHHWAQLEVIRHLAARTGPFAIGMEMVQRPFQGVLDDYAAGRIDDDAMTARTGWADRWGYDFKLYRPMLHVAIEHKDALLALNASKELVKRIAHDGLASLTPDEKKQVPELVLDDARHRAWFDGVMAAMGGTMHGAKAAKDDQDGDGHGDKDDNVGKDDDRKHGDDDAPADKAADKAAADRMYSVQVLWDESMASGAATWLTADRARQVVILAGDGHCHDSAVVGRIKRRGIATAVSVRPVIDDGEGNVAELLAQPIYDYLFVMSMPPGAKK